MHTKHILLCLGLASIGALAITSCSKQNEEAKKTIEFEQFNGSELFKLDNTAKVFQTDNDILYQDSANLLLPVSIENHDITALRDSIMKAAFDTVAAPEEAMKKLFKAAVDDLGYSYEAAPDTLPRNDIDGSTIVNGDVFCMSTSRITFRVTNYTYFPGAAHGMTITRFVNYSICDNKVISLNDIFTAEGIAKLPAAINTKAKQLAPVIGPTDEITAVPTNGNYYINLDDAITFVYQPYEIASYAQGLIQIPFYAYQLSDYMTPYGLKLFNLGE